MPDPARAPLRRTMRRQEQLNAPRFLTFSCFHRLRLFQNDAIKNVFASALAAARAEHRFRLFAWVIMPEHVHLLIVPRPAVGFRDGRQIFASASTVRAILHDLKGSVSRTVLARWRQLRAPVLARLADSAGRRHFWQRGGGFDHNTRHEWSLLEQIQYMHHNPVRRGLVTQATDWAWSSARWYAGERQGQIPIDFAPGARWRPPEDWIAQGAPAGPRHACR